MKAFKLILVISWCSLIFLLSNQNGTSSGGLSTKIIYKVVNILHNNESEEYKYNLVDKYSLVVRKAAHFTEYFILALFIYLYLKEYNLNKIYLYVILFCFLYAISDEVHQLFIDGRCGSFIDILIDTSGSFFFSLIVMLLNKRKVKYD